MTKSVFVATVIVLLNLAVCPLLAQNTTKNYKVSGFSSIELQSVGDIIFTQSANYSCRIEGSAEYIEKTDVTVKDKKIIIGYKQKGENKVKNLKIYISAPDLTKVEIDGVGNMKLKVNCRTIDAKVDGVGNITLSGKADQATIKREGIGKINYNKLDCKRIMK